MSPRRAARTPSRGGTGSPGSRCRRRCPGRYPARAIGRSIAALQSCNPESPWVSSRSGGVEDPGATERRLPALAVLFEVGAERAQRPVGVVGELMDRERGGGRVAAAAVAAVVEARRAV